MSNNSVYIVSACRTPIGAFNGQFSKIPAVTLASTTIRETIRRCNIDSASVSEVIMGHVITTGLGQNTARQAALLAGLPNDIPACTVNMVCGSGLKAVYDGFNSIKTGENSIVVCGGMENMSMAKHFANLRSGCKLGAIQMEDTILTDGLVDSNIKMHMGKTAEHLVREYKVSRVEQDEFAFQSQRKAQDAITNGYFKEELIGVEDSKGNLIEKDEHVRFGTTLEGLAKLKPAFETDGSVTAGNASGINDGAAALLICNSDVLKEKQFTPLARIVGFAQCGLEPIEMGLGPIKAIRKLMEKTKWSLEEVDLFEINEAFAVQSLLVVKALNIDSDKVNVSGGAIALGHPIGCSGARVLVTLLYNLKRLGKRKGVAALCIGGGMGIAVAVEIDA
ncbi:acetyl-coa c-acyltransferase [Holotrichia oblita]|uniref:Acetyl-coa c-acyltransferase n=1 Tax=Holotrichia oblita TaxID=644536 RepID=A0ACB9SJI5_HOLOL|nr:acetyl-coa c-acyltransferase [Holotrichia oblita]